MQRWWLAARGIDETEEIVQAALDALVALGELGRHVLSDGTAVYFASPLEPHAKPS